MNKFLSFMLLVLLIFSMSGCNANRMTYSFLAQGVEISLSANASFKMSCKNMEPLSSITFFDTETNDYKGAVTICCEDRADTVEELYDLYYFNKNGHNKTLIRKNLMFIDEFSTFPSGDPNNWYRFILFNDELNVSVCGQFSDYNTDRNEVLSIAKSIRLKSGEKKSPYPDDYTQINPEISIFSSHEQVTEYCTIPKTWKNEEFDTLSHQQLLKDKKVYLLSGDCDNIVFDNDEHGATTFYAKTDHTDVSLFNEGARGFRIYRLDIGNEEFYVFITAEYGISGELTYVFKCKFQ